jgi:hypothetical protein
VLPLTVEEGIADGLPVVRHAVRYQVKQRRCLTCSPRHPSTSAVCQAAPHHPLTGAAC